MRGGRDVREVRCLSSVFDAPRSLDQFSMDRKCSR
jgi:hypothetical protein